MKLYELLKQRDEERRRRMSKHITKHCEAILEGREEEFLEEHRKTEAEKHRNYRLKGNYKS